MNQIPKMRTSAPLSPEQIRAVVGQHRDLVKHRRYIRVRTIVRVTFWLTILTGLWLFLVWTDALNDYENTCEALAQVCKK